MLFCTRHTRAILPLHTHCKTLFNLCQRHFGDIPAGDIPNDSSDIHNIGAFFHLFSLSQIGKLQPCVSPPTATCHVWCCCDKNHGAASGDGLHMLMALFAVEPCCMWALLLFTKWHTSMSKAWMNRTAVTSEPCNSQERQYSCELLRPQQFSFFGTTDREVCT